MDGIINKVIRMKVKNCLLFFLTALYFIVCQNAGYALTDPTNTIHIIESKKSFAVKTGQTIITVSIRNISSKAIPKPLYIAVKSITPSNVKVANPDGYTSEGYPYFDYSSNIPGESLDKGEMTTTKWWHFNNPQNKKFTYTAAIVNMDSDSDKDKDGYTVSQGDCDDNNPAVYPGAKEICDDADNNCNGQINEGFNVGAACAAGVGACQRTGVMFCSADGSGAICNAAPGAPAPEICDGLDNDCDGPTDEGFDADGDRTADCFDGCPNDANKTEPGICGCGIPDTDTDADGTADCFDACIDDPNKTESGICGCNAADMDTDGDGAFDCIDKCVNDPNKTEPGICGCGVTSHNNLTQKSHNQLNVSK